MNNELNSSTDMPEPDPIPEETEAVIDADIDTVVEKDDKSKYRQPRKTGNNKAVTIIVICVLAVLLICGTIFGLSRLHKEKPYDNTAQFYFSSDLLSETGNEYSVYDEIRFTVRNYADELRCSAQDIESVTFTVTCEGKDITSECTVTSDLQVLPASKPVDSNVRIIVPERYDGIPVEVKAVSAPIEISLIGSFTVLPSWGSELKDSAGSVNATFVIWADEDVDFTVSWDTDALVADPTNAYVKASENDGECTVSLLAGTGTEIVFFKSDIIKDYSGTDAVTATVSGKPHDTEGE